LLSESEHETLHPDLYSSLVASDAGNNGADFRSAFIPLYASVAIAAEGWTIIDEPIFKAGEPQIWPDEPRRKDYGDFACIIIVEEAQYFAPEKGAEIRESSAQSEAKASMIEAISQAGGYNVGLIIITQRPAYVLKSCISQCNSVACFRLRSGNDQDAILEYTEYGSERLRDYLPGLADHEAMLWGLAVPTPFPIIIEVNVEEYPRKAAVFAKSAWERMEKRNPYPCRFTCKIHRLMCKQLISGVRRQMLWGQR
jgi:DNA helicase HerA-like ATPase